MLRRHGPLILAITLIVLVAAACIVRTGPRRNHGPGPVYRTAPDGDHRQGKHKKHKKQRKHLHEAPYENAPRDLR